MEFNEKLQELRKKRGITQDELAEAIFVSRTAVSKWETGRGYPSIDSLKAIAKYFSVTVDELLSCEEIITVAQEENKEKEKRFRDLVFALLDISVSMVLFLPFFGQQNGEMITGVSLFDLSGTGLYLKISYFVLVIAIAVFGVVGLVIRNSFRKGNKISLALNCIGTFVFIISTQPYAAAFLFVLLIIKAFLIIKSNDTKGVG